MGAWYPVKAADAEGVEGKGEWQWERLPEEVRGFVVRIAEERPALASVLRYQ